MHLVMHLLCKKENNITLHRLKVLTVIEKETKIILCFNFYENILPYDVETCCKYE